MGRIIREVFSPELHSDVVAEFDCGQEEWQLAVSNWIKGTDPTDAAVTDIATRGTQVWLYWDEQENLVGFGSLGLHHWTLPPYGKKKVPVVIIPSVAVAMAYWGQPPDDPYSLQIMDDLHDEAQRYVETHRALVLCVHPANARAIKFYRRYGFAVIEPPLSDGHLRMALYLGIPPSTEPAGT